MMANFRMLFLTLLVISLITCTSKSGKSFTEPILGIEFVKIPKGNFIMGNTEISKEDTIGSSHEVFITKEFWLGKTEVTQKQWSQIMGHQEPHLDKPSPFRGLYPNYPVVSISYLEVERFLEKLNNLSKDYFFRLPTEEEWEYACRAGTKTPFSFGEKLYDSMANFNTQIPSEFTKPGKYIGHPMPVGSYPANKWGLFDMHGNVWEWVDDWYDSIPSASKRNQNDQKTSTEKLLKGGSWYFGAKNAQSSFRKAHSPELWGFSIGFRIVCEKRK